MNEVHITTIVKQKTRIKNSNNKKFDIIMHNNALTLMSIAMFMLHKIFKFTLNESYDVAMEVHTKGSKIVFSGDRYHSEKKKQEFDNVKLVLSKDIDVLINDIINSGLDKSFGSELSAFSLGVYRNSSEFKSFIVKSLEALTVSIKEGKSE